MPLISYIKLIFTVLLLSISQISFALATQTLTVHYSPLNKLTYLPQHSFSASIIAHSESNISSELNARLIDLPIRLGQNIKKGELLAKLDCHDFKDKLKLNKSLQKQAQAKLNLAKLQLKRFQSLESAKHAATRQVDEAISHKLSIEAKIEGLKVKANMAKRAIQRCTITAPFDAVITKIYTGEGQWMSVGSLVANLVKTNDAEIVVNLPFSTVQAWQGKLAIWQTKNQPAVKVEKIRQSGVINPQQRMVNIWFKAPKNNPIGLHGTLLIEMNQPHISPAYIVTRKGKLGVFVAENNKAKFYPLPNAQIGRPALVPSYWHSKLAIIIKGQQRLQNGMAINIEPWAENLNKEYYSR